ncbi:hypothetical protein QR685DRAFT_575079 [Neurospora intermedia]|uniref:Uncharacterized protein n=1 Tax=Neurospora intermedia TaxID=5142 RepID=A0ABR3D2U1_NEUIN
MFSTDQIRLQCGGAEASTAFAGPRAVIGKREVYIHCIGEQGQKSKLRSSSESQRHLRCETRLCVICRTRDSLRE